MIYNHNKSLFYPKAKKHQICFKEQVLGLLECGKFPVKLESGKEMLMDVRTLLCRNDAEEGKNFYEGLPEILKTAKERFGKDNYKESLYANMLRSEHIPFNLFAPLKSRMKENDTIYFLNEVFPNTDIRNIKEIKIEYAPPGKKKYLDDNTSFDTYVAYKNSKNEECGLGIEVKYTEESYPFGETERKRMNGERDDSKYQPTHKESGIYIDGSIEKLATIPLKQFWRNHLLGLKMVQNGDIKRFFSAHIFPSGNTYQKEKSEDYSRQIKPEFRYQFIPVTYETYFEKIVLFFGEDEKYIDWAKYLKNRYIVKE
ncbi:MAG: hypothetical protein AB2L26_01680 [Ignavibacteria bacterium]